MIKYVDGCLIEAVRNGEVNVIAHGCSCFNRMETGIAPLIKQTFPVAWEADQKTKYGDICKLGSYSKAFDTEHDLLIYNLYTQYDYKGRNFGKRDINYEAIYTSLEGMAESLHKYVRIMGLDWDDIKIGIPKIGGGLGGGRWEIIEQMVDFHLGYFEPTVYVKFQED